MDRSIDVFEFFFDDNLNRILVGRGHDTYNRTPAHRLGCRMPSFEAMRRIVPPRFQDRCSGYEICFYAAFGEYPTDQLYAALGTYRKIVVDRVHDLSPGELGIANLHDQRIGNGIRRRSGLGWIGKTGKRKLRKIDVLGEVAPGHQTRAEKGQHSAARPPQSASASLAGIGHVRAVVVGAKTARVCGIGSLIARPKTTIPASNGYQGSGQWNAHRSSDAPLLAVWTAPAVWTTPKQPNCGLWPDRWPQC